VSKRADAGVINISLKSGKYVRAVVAPLVNQRLTKTLQVRGSARHIDCSCRGKLRLYVKQSIWQDAAGPCMYMAGLAIDSLEAPAMTHPKFTMLRSTAGTFANH
jgi:hypothetical protein